MPAVASAASKRGLYGERYCEIIALRGELPEVTATVYNTIGFNDCPAAWWDALDPNQVAAGLGAFLVRMNGPRHWVIDRASSAGITNVIDVEGEALGEVAAIPLRTPADFSSTPYTERTIVRDNLWRWRAHRRVYTLSAPDGQVYMMQAFSQIVDPALRLPDLAGLGARLELPDGWRFETSKLRRPFVLDAGGTATIIQDELQNTYQRIDEDEIARAGEPRRLGPVVVPTAGRSRRGHPRRRWRRPLWTARRFAPEVRRARH